MTGEVRARESVALAVEALDGQGVEVEIFEAAQELGYHDQPHLIRDFREQVGFTPGAYARRCEAAITMHARR